MYFLCNGADEKNFKASHQDKNALLEELNALFPEHDVSDLRQALATQSYCNLYLAVDDLLQYEKTVERQKLKNVTLRTRVGLDR